MSLVLPDGWPVSVSVRYNLEHTQLPMACTLCVERGVQTYSEWLEKSWGGADSGGACC